MIDVRRLAHATLTTPDLDRQVAYYTEVIGLALLDRGARHALLASKQGLEAIALAPGPPNALAQLAFQVAPGRDLADVAGALSEQGIKSEWRSDISPGIADSIVFRDPNDTQIQIFSEYRFPAEDPTQAGIMPIKLGHVAYRVRDVQAVVKFYTDVLGFRVSDWRDDSFAFLRCGPDHHSVNFVHDEVPQLHHIAFEVKDWAEIQRACEWLAKNGFNPEKAKGVEIGNAARFLKTALDQPSMVLHELAHAYHDRVLGFGHAGLLEAYREAKKAGAYESVLRIGGARERHYALTDPQEYFAEGTEAFFGTNDFYPFVRAELRVHDPKLFRLLEELWR